MKIPRGLIAVVRFRCLTAVGLFVFFAYLFANNLDPTPAVAHQLGCRPEVCKRWQDRYRRDWEQLLNRARWKVAQETFVEALHILMTNMRSRDEKVRHEAAKIVERYLGRGSGKPGI